MPLTNTPRAARAVLMAGVLVCLTLLSGCLVLSKSQVKEVNRFATATQNYTQVPTTLVQGYGEVRQSKKYMAAATATSPDVALSYVTEAEAFTGGLAKQVQRMESSLAVLRNYASLLKALSAKDFDDALKEEAQNLSKQLDKSIEAYNKLRGASVPAIGNPIGKLVDAIGGLYIRRKQYTALKAAIVEGEKAVPPMVDSLLKVNNLFLPDSPAMLLQAERESILDEFKLASNKHGGTMPMVDVDYTARQLRRLHGLEAMANANKSAGEKFQQAFARLQREVVEKRDLDTAIEQVKTFVDEVDDGLKAVKSFRDI